MTFSTQSVIPSDGHPNEVFPKFNAGSFNIWSRANPELAQDLKNITVELLVDARVSSSDKKDKISFKKIEKDTKFIAIATSITIFVIGIIFISGFLLGRFL